jgi:hypothetical protein
VVSQLARDLLTRIQILVAAPRLSRMARPLLGKDILSRARPNSHDRRYIAPSLLKKTTYASEAPSRSDTSQS